MEIFLDTQSYYNHLQRLAEQRPKSIFIGSYGIYAGITTDGRDSVQWGDKFQLYSRDFLESIKAVPDVRILIGVPEFRSCTKQACEDCEFNYIASLIRILNHAYQFNQYKWKLSESSHFKGVLMIYDSYAKGVIGGRNLNDSSFFDASYTIDGKDCVVLTKMVFDYYKTCEEISDNSISKILENKGISAKSIEKMVSNI